MNTSKRVYVTTTLYQGVECPIIERGTYWKIIEFRNSFYSVLDSRVNKEVESKVRNSFEGSNYKELLEVALLNRLNSIEKKIEKKKIEKKIVKIEIEKKMEIEDPSSLREKPSLTLHLEGSFDLLEKVFTYYLFLKKSS